MEVLLIEDNLGDVDLVKYGFNESNVEHSLSVISNGVEALRYLKKEKPYEESPRPSLILLDLRIPLLNGKTVLKNIKELERLRSIPVIVFSSSHDPQDVGTCYALGANSFVAKPMNLEEYIGKIKEIANYWNRVSLWTA